MNKIQPLWMSERDAILQALEAHGYVLQATAKSLQISKMTLYLKIEIYKYQGCKVQPSPYLLRCKNFAGGGKRGRPKAKPKVAPPKGSFADRYPD